MQVAAGGGCRSRRVVEAGRGGVNTAWEAVRLVRLWFKAVSIVNSKQPLTLNA